MYQKLKSVVDEIDNQLIRNDFDLMHQRIFENYTICMNENKQECQNYPKYYDQLQNILSKTKEDLENCTKQVDTDKCFQSVQNRCLVDIEKQLSVLRKI
ncbi:hypothetical protein pb186bvf_003688 [Paramecium bursaria]